MLCLLSQDNVLLTIRPGTTAESEEEEDPVLVVHPNFVISE